PLPKRKLYQAKSLVPGAPPIQLAESGYAPFPGALHSLVSASAMTGPKPAMTADAAKQRRRRLVFMSTTLPQMRRHEGIFGVGDQRVRKRGRQMPPRPSAQEPTQTPPSGPARIRPAHPRSA